MADEKFVNGWPVLRELGSGGQGDVYLVLHPDRAAAETKAIHDIDNALRQGGAIAQTPDKRIKWSMELARGVTEVTRPHKPAELGAAKRYKIPKTKDSEKALGRLKVEIETLRKNEEPSLLRLIDANADERWMITEYHQRETLAHHPDLFKGQPIQALTAFRDLVRGVVALHNAGVVHRDIKPANIFVADDGRLVLGDFGIVFVENNGRLTETFEKVGTSDWMAPWARLGGRVDDVKPSFDVFPLAKVLWSMLSGQPVLPFWYFNLDADAYRHFDLTRMFPNISAMHHVNEQILSATLVQHEKDCLDTAGALLNRVEEVLKTVSSDGQVLSRSKMSCLVCGRGFYRLRYDKDSERLRMLSVMKLPEPQYAPQTHFMLADGNWVTVRVHTCDQCGHVALFQFPDRLPPPAWKGRE